MKTETQCLEIVCDHSIAERPRYYARQLITDETLRLEQEYFIDRMRRHNRLLHGWGVVCGGQVCPNPACKTNGIERRPWEVVVKPGYILGPYGDEIVIDCERVVDLRTRGVSGVTGEPCVEPVDPWCSDVYAPRDAEKPLYVAVKYKECQTRPVRVQPIGCGCDDTQCEYSRLRDGYEIGVLNCCPEPAIEEHKVNPRQTPVGKIGVTYSFNSVPDVCPTCPTEPWVVLARVRVDGNGTITEIDNCECRRIVISFGSVALACETSQPTIAAGPDSIQPASANQKQNVPGVIIKGENFKHGMCVDLGTGIKVDNEQAEIKEDGTQITVNIAVDEHAYLGKRRLTLTNPDCGTVIRADAFEVKESATAASAPAAAQPTATKPAFTPRPRGRRPAPASKKAKP